MSGNKWGIDLSSEHKIACPRCRRNGRDRAGNNLHVYGQDKGAYCWSCEFTIPSKEHRESMGWDEDESEEEVTTREKITEEENKKVKSYTGNDCKGWRGIRKETNAFFGVRYQYSEETGEPVKMFVPTTIDYELSGYKVRTFPKDFTGPIGIVGKDCDMVGEFRFKNFNKICLLVGGETKMLCAYQMLNDDRIKRGKEAYDPTAVVSTSVGESGAWKQVQKRYKFFDQFEKIIICMDNDEAGHEATEKIAAVLPKGKVFVMKMRYKDADIYIEKNDEKSFINDFWRAAPYVPAGIVGSGDLKFKIIEEASLLRIPFPPFMEELNEMTAGGIPLGKIVNIGAGSGLGKTVYVNEMIYFWVFHSPYRIGVVSMELNSGQYGLVMLSRHMRRKILNIRDVDERIKFLESPEAQQAQDNLFYTSSGDHRWHLVDDRDGSLEQLKDTVEELVISCGCRVIILDPLQDILDGMTNEEQAVFLKWQKGLIKSHKVTFININHVRKAGNSGDTASTGKMITEEDFAGSSTIFKSAALNILLRRDKMNEDEIERNTTYAYLSKNRDNGVTGPCGEYYFDNETHTLWNKKEWVEKHPVEY